MALRALTDNTEIKSAKHALEQNIIKNTLPFTRNLGWKGGYRKMQVRWRPREEFWIARCTEDTFYWFGYGNTNPDTAKSLSITCATSIPIEGVGRRTAGAFGKDSYGHIYLTHSGKVGGGKKGVGKSEFLKAYRGDSLETIFYPDGNERDMIVLGRIDSPELPRQIKHFITEVHRFKYNLLHQSSSPDSENNEDLIHTYKPEFSGSRTAYPFGKKIEANCHHGVVVDALATLLQDKGLSFANNQHHDLYTYNDSKQITAVFEIKTDLTSSSVYSAIGQLQFNSAFYSKCKSLIALFPGKPNTETKKIFDKLGISIHSYHRRGSQVFFEIDDAILQVLK